MELEVGCRNLEAIRGKSGVFNKIILNFSSLYKKGLLNIALKYSSFSIKVGGMLEIRGLQNRIISQTNQEINRIIRYAFYKQISHQFNVINMNVDKCEIVAIKTKPYVPPNGFSIGILFSGMEEEYSFLDACVNSVHWALEDYDGPHEIIVSAPTHSKVIINQLVTSYPKLTIRHHQFDSKDTKRFQIGRKKNSIFSTSQYTGVIIAHNRIRFGYRMFKYLHDFPFEVATPQVNFLKNKRLYRYMDYVFLEHYDHGRPSRLRKLGATWVEKDYLAYFKRRIPYIDGGIIIINGNAVFDPPWDQRLSWGEAEDVELSARLFQQGFLLDYIHEIKCTSESEKFPVDNHVKNILIKLSKPLFKKGLL